MIRRPSCSFWIQYYNVYSGTATISYTTKVKVNVINLAQPKRSMKLFTDRSYVKVIISFFFSFFLFRIICRTLAIAGNLMMFVSLMANKSFTFVTPLTRIVYRTWMWVCRLQMKIIRVSLYIGIYYIWKLPILQLSLQWVQKQTLLRNNTLYFSNQAYEQHLQGGLKLDMQRLNEDRVQMKGEVCKTVFLTILAKAFV